MQKILIITHAFLPDIGGGNIVAYDYANLLVSLGYDVTVLSKEYPAPIQNTAFRYLQVPNKYGDYLTEYNYCSYLKRMNLIDFDHIILNLCISSSIAGRYFPESILSKCISIIQGEEVEWIYDNKRFFSNLFHNIILCKKKYHLRALIGSRKIVSVSETHKNKVIRAAHLEKYEDKFQVVYTGIDKDVFHYVDSDFRAQHGLQNKRILISVSRIVKMKGYIEMFSIFKQIAENICDVVWVIIGDGPFLNKLSDLISRNNLCNRVILLGRIDRIDLKYYYSAADCFWLLSNYDECLPLVYLEAQACGIPAIGRNKGGVVETIKHNETGFLVNSESECLDILLNEKYLDIEKDNLQSFVSKFDKICATKELIS